MTTFNSALRKKVLGTKLTKRQRQMAQLIAQDLSSKECAKALGIQYGTAQGHRRMIMAKLGGGVAIITRYAVGEGLVSAEIPGQRALI